MISMGDFGTGSKFRRGKSDVVLLLGTCKYFEASLILSGRCAPERFEYFFMPQMFIRSSSACIKIPAKSSRNVYVLANKFTVGNKFYPGPICFLLLQSYLNIF